MLNGLHAKGNVWGLDSDMPVKMMPFAPSAGYLANPKGVGIVESHPCRKERDEDGAPGWHLRPGITE